MGLGSVWERPVGRRAEREVMVGGGEGWRRLGKEYLEVAVALPALLSGDFPSLPGLGLFKALLGELLRGELLRTPSVPPSSLQ